MKKHSTARNLLAAAILVVVFGLGYLLFGGGFSQLRDAGGKPIILEVDFDRTLVEDANESPLAALGLRDRLTLQKTLAALEAASADERVKLLIARVGMGAMGQAQRQDIRDAILRFRQSGKKAYAFAETFGEFSGGTGNYYLATAFDQIFLQPSGDLGLTGIIAEPMFVRGALDKLELVPRGGQRHEYKNALDFFTEKQMTPPYREAIETLLQSLHRQTVTGIAEGRRMPPEKVQELVDSGPHLGPQALETGLVDQLLYRDQVYARARDEVRGARLLYLNAYLDKRGNPYAKGKPIAVIYGVGGVQRGKSTHNPLTDEDVMGSDTVCAGFRAATDDKKIKTIIFRVDCPGGSYVASDAVLREITRAREKGKKVVISMGNVAASGGYIVALAADRVIAQPGTITGSIGVLALKLLSRGFWNKFGITWDSAQTARNAHMWTGLSDYSPEQMDKFNAWLDRIYVEFTDKVAQGRRLPKERVLEIAKGRVWSGEDALRLGLVDELGGFTRAIEVARELTQIPAGEKVKLVRFPKPKSLLQQLSGDKDESSESVLLRSLLETVRPLRPALRAAREMGASPAESVVELPETEIQQ